MSAQIKVLGVLHEKHEKLFQEKSIFTRKGENEAILVCDYSLYDIPIGHTFREILNDDKKLLGSGRIILHEVSQGYLKHFDCIPSGHKTVCRFEFADEVKPIIKQLPSIDGWGDNRCISIYFS